MKINNNAEIEGVTQDIENGKIALDYIEHITTKFGPRPPGSEAERSAQKSLEGDLREHCDDTIFDSFHSIRNLYPQGMAQRAGITYLIGFFFYWASTPWTILGLLLPILAVGIFFSTLYLMKTWFGFGMPKNLSHNALGKIHPRDKSGNKTEAKKKIIVAGHMDSAYEMHIVKYGDNIAKITFSAIGYIVLTAVFSLIKTILLAIPSVAQSIIITSGDNGFFVFTYIDAFFALISFVGLPLFLFVIYCYSGRKPIDGANDNLAGVGISYALAKYFSKDENRLKNVELVVGAFGSEECGERGSHYFVKTHGEPMNLKNSYTVIPESCGAGSNLGILTEEKMHFAVHDPEVYNRLWTAYTDVKEKQFENGVDEEEIVPCEVISLQFAASDAGRFSHAGYPASTLLGYNGKIMKPENWHAVTDTVDNLEPAMLNTSFEIIAQFIKNVDEELGSNKKDGETIGIDTIECQDSSIETPEINYAR